MAKELISDELWAEIEPLLPPPKPRRFHHPGRKPLDRRKALTGILFVLKSGIPWQYLPKEMDCGSGMSCWRYLKSWQEQGVWDQIQQVFLAKLREADKIDFSRAIVDSASIRAALGGEKTGPNPTDRRKLGTKHHVITDAGGILLAVITTGANHHDLTQLLPLFDAIPAIRGKRGRPRKKPDCVQGDRGYDYEPHRIELLSRGIIPVLAKRMTPHGSGLGQYRWVVERTLSWLHQFRRLRVRWERRADIHQAFLLLGCILICWNALKRL
jgi:transposase